MKSFEQWLREKDYWRTDLFLLTYPDPVGLSAHLENWEIPDIRIVSATPAAEATDKAQFLWFCGEVTDRRMKGFHFHDAARYLTDYFKDIQLKALLVNDAKVLKIQPLNWIWHCCERCNVGMVLISPEQDKKRLVKKTRWNFMPDYMLSPRRLNLNGQEIMLEDYSEFD
ncbi:hypothetical protein H6G00_01605 [Leptolyngbya sp. FACHB-541]|uniref:hypothetical protein n=1 Tax=Leptolyngbya sp. FACHB-541 TaxID=2692810 RepID=UPI001681FDD8|nr:hypothetical protein [Leptolyngbya sp. FACHB-541]MBD1995326.1 hypothetical protein [Leptolyngbya sp. FACHB-541]